LRSRQVAEGGPVLRERLLHLRLVIPGCGGITPKVHRASLFDLTAEEWAATRELLLLVRAELHKRLAPDSYTLGWNHNGLHPHLHVIPRFDDEPMSDQGVRSGIKDPGNRRPDPWRPGTGRHIAGARNEA
jgi:diadenosine tetraphosphate (Ap4A) HIT family hydrolase